MKQSISNLVTDKQVLNFHQSVRDNGGSSAVAEEFAIVVRPNVATDGDGKPQMFKGTDKKVKIPFTISGDYLKTKNYKDKKNNDCQAHLIRFSKYVGEKEYSFVGIVFGFSSLNTNMAKLSLNSEDRIKINYQGLKDHNGTIFSSSWVEKVGETQPEAQPEAQPEPKNKKKPTKAEIEANNKLLADTNKAGDELPF